jgi:signal transduction histidine kinase
VPPVPPTSPAPSPSDPRPAGRRSGAGRERSRKTLTPEQRAYREAKAAANRKIGFLAHAIPFAAVNLMLLLVAGFRPAMIVSLTWGIGLAVHWFFAIAAPGMRQRMIDQEVRRRVHQGVSDERVSLEGDHQRRLEELSASIAHEIRNPITAAKSLVQQMGEDPAASDNVEYAKVALDELQRVEKSVAHLLRYAREEEVAVTEVRIGEVVESAIETFRDRIEQIGVTVESDVLEAGTMQGDPDKLRRVLINLLGNALDAFQESHTPSPLIAVQAGENLAGTEVWVRVRDNGPGIEPAQLERVFDPFYTSKSSGTGLGLAISKKLVDAHGGSIEAQSQPGSGTEFVITFPKAGGHPEPSRRNAAEPA